MIFKEINNNFPCTQPKISHFKPLKIISQIFYRKHHFSKPVSEKKMFSFLRYSTKKRILKNGASKNSFIRHIINLKELGLTGESKIIWYVRTFNSSSSNLNGLL